ANLGAGSLTFQNSTALNVSRVTANAFVSLGTTSGGLTTSGPIVSNGAINLLSRQVTLGGSVTSTASTVFIAGTTITQSATQTLQLGGSGTFTLTFNGRTTPPIAANASAAVIQAALNALSSIGGRGGSVAVAVVNGAL